MTANVEVLIRSLGKGYQAVFDAGIIPYKTRPQGTQSDEFLSIDMKKEGIFLSFKNNQEKTLSQVIIKILKKGRDRYFPNELPTPFQVEMSRRWVHENFGEPENSIPPRVIMKQEIGWVERFTVVDFHIPITMQIRYDMEEMVEAVTFLPTSDLRW
ncbi:DUF6392 family protein [Enterobacter mori]|jgi:hypothetical protein|nr:pyocin immunity protein [Enterobacter mori]EME8860182.1 pyocin immunity protein [Enterobacter mori]